MKYEELVCGKENKGCDFCESNEVCACIEYFGSEGNTAHIHLCGDCDNQFTCKLTTKAKKRLNYTEF